MCKLLLHCNFAHALWSEVFLMFGIQWVMPRTVASCLFAWRNFLGKHYSDVWNMVPACLMWLIWKEQNISTFEDTEKPIDLLKSLLVGTLFEWSQIWALHNVFPFLISYNLLFLLPDLFVIVSNTICSLS